MAAYEVLLLNTAVPQIQAAQAGDTYVVPRDIAFNAGFNIVNNDATIYGVTVGRGAGAVSTNTAVGASALAANTTGANNTAVGYQAGLALNTGLRNTLLGRQAGPAIVGDVDNTFVGSQAGFANNGGIANTGVGSGVMPANTAGNYNVAVGVSALNANTTASNNTAVGYQAGYAATVGGYNTFVGYQSGVASNFTTDAFANNTFIGALSGSAITTGRKNTILGLYNGNQGGLDIRTLDNHVVLSDGDGNPRAYHDATNWYLPSVDAQTTGGAANVNVGTNGVLRKSTSSLKYKRDVQDATHGLAEVLALRPVTYKSKSALDGDIVYGGFIAEEVDAVGLKEFVMYAPDGSPDGLAYGNMTSVLVKAIQELKAEFDAYKATHP